MLFALCNDCGVIRKKYGLPVSSGYRFCGVLDSWPIGAFKYLEDDGGDDIVLQNFCFGVREVR